MRETLAKIKEQALEQIASPDADLDALRVKYLGKKGELTAVLRGMGQLTPEERPVVGQIANEIRADIEAAMTARKETLAAEALERQLKEEKLDVTMPGNASKMGHVHPLNLVQRDLEDIFIGLAHFFFQEGSGCISMPDGRLTEKSIILHYSRPFDPLQLLFFAHHFADIVAKSGIVGLLRIFAIPLCEADRFLRHAVAVGQAMPVQMCFDQSFHLFYWDHPSPSSR